MSNNLPQLYKNNMFKKLFSYIRKLFMFKTQDVMNEENEINTIKKEKVEKHNDFSETLKVENYPIDKEIEKQRFMDNLKDNLQLLDIFSNERLETILQYYLNENEKKKALLNKLSI